MANAYTRKIFMGIFGYEQPKYTGSDPNVSGLAENDVRYFSDEKVIWVNVGEIRWWFDMSIMIGDVRMTPAEVVWQARQRIAAEYERRAARYR